MSPLRSRLYPALLAAMLLALLSSSQSVVAAAGRPLSATGTFHQETFVQSNTRVNGVITEFDFTATSTVSGTMMGTSVATGHCVVKASAEGQCVARETLVGTVDGRAGTGEFLEVITLDFATQSNVGSFTVLSGTGDLKNLHGAGTFQGSGADGTYSARLVFA